MRELLEKLQRDPESHKGENGKVGVIGGSKDYTGAPALSAKAALRTGCDLVTILTSNSVSSTVAGFSENFIVRDYRSDYFGMEALEKALDLDDEVDTVVIGPGLGNPESKAIHEFIERCESPLVIDADALENLNQLNVEKTVLTPHEAEFKAIEENLERLLNRDNVVVRKGATDTVYSKNRETNIETGHPSMTVGGTGDVLTGIIASLISQGQNLEEAARLGSWLNGKSGEKAAEEYGNSVLATDIAERIPKIITSEM